MSTQPPSVGPVTVLLFSDGSDAAEIYRQHLPAGWRLEYLTDRHDEGEQRARLANADILLHVDVPLTSAHLDAAPALRLIHRQGVGLDGLELEAVRSRGIPVCICPVGTPEAVAEHTIMLALACGRHLTALSEGVRANGWPKWTYRQRSLGLMGATVGLVGFGRIAQAVARRLLPFEAQILVHRSRPQPLDPEWPDGRVRRCDDLDELFAASDVVSLHCPLTPETTGLVHADRLARMRDGSVLVNTARGGLVVEEDLARALAAGRPAAAGLDVLSAEPPGEGHPLVGLPNALITPHCAAGVATVVHRKAEAVFENAQRALAGEELWYRAA
ncbi:hypothetical protein ER308_13610 [Egibacter rhizosphaerae]|uniref:Hydroxyacid dehydrogenase n=1 Tax=Egibacter rhizosphaerae TaxID=1670831 RepID=A0A411YH12_9ACTN|nr:NAD(P)-dependent oxidoreductase [Egibacter rhizosphaerae]QBI20497.1 hypothetical protein ER308_13610 [Egibacter rhizosphaerae]